MIGNYCSLIMDCYNNDELDKSSNKKHLVVGNPLDELLAIADEIIDGDMTGADDSQVYHVQPPTQSPSVESPRLTEDILAKATHQLCDDWEVMFPHNGLLYQ